MRLRWALAPALLAAPACAALLGIDDGTLRDDAGLDATVDQLAGDVSIDVTPEAEAAPPPIVVACGDAGCAIGESVCCRHGGNANLTYACVTDAATCSGSNNPQLIPCDRAEACASVDAGADAAPTVCCADSYTNDSGTGLTKVFCTSQTTCLGTGVVMCILPDAGDAGSGSCPSPRTCKPSIVIVPGYGICI
ncbi:hypothetical protein BH09MYX1_BH09MYX1_38040 [soil metagenome]